MKKSKESKLFSSESEINSEEFSKIVKYFKSDFKSLGYYYLISSTFGVLIASIICGFLFYCLIVGLSIFIVSLVATIIYLNYNYILYYTKLFKNVYKEDKKINIDYYDKYLLFDNKKLNYKDIIRSVETDSDFFIKYESERVNESIKYGILNIKKNDLELEEISLLREKIKDTLENHLGEVENPIILNQHDLKGETLKIHRLLLVLFVLTIVCLFVPQYIGNAFDVENVDKVKYYILGFLIVPVLSIVFGIIYYRKGYKTLKNIVAGVLVGLYLIFEAYVFNNVKEYILDYNIIYSYKDYLDVELPNNGIIINSNVLGNYNVYYMVSYDEDNALMLVNNLEKNNNWIKSSDYNEELNKLLLDPKTSYDDYIMIYNKTTKEYNILPSEDGKYDMLVVTFNNSTATLQIKEYSIVYSK